ncbi:hypothetical protein BGZ52_006981 [Haplosporangium bisporale]|nr:hypothetical protein BGZ52_006981 [Haplosporangium bisporale]
MTAAQLPTPADDIKYMVLFGIPGAGKSSIANMLTQGDLFGENTSHIANETTAGTQTIITLRGEGWAVTDTVGMAADDVDSPRVENALNQLEEYLRTNRQGFHYIAYVIRREEIPARDHKRLFQLFQSCFQDAEDNFVLIITHCRDPRWADDKRNELQEIFGNLPIIACDFPYAKEAPRDDQASRKIGREMLVRDLLKLPYNRTKPTLSQETPKETLIREKFEKDPSDQKVTRSLKRFISKFHKGSSTSTNGTNTTVKK